MKAHRFLYTTEDRRIKQLCGQVNADDERVIALRARIHRVISDSSHVGDLGTERTKKNLDFRVYLVRIKILKGSRYLALL